MTRIQIASTGADHYRVEVTDGNLTTAHVVTVSPPMLERLGTAGTATERVVRKSFEFLLEREPASSILPEFSLDDISRYFPDYPAEIRSRLEGS